MSVTWPSLVGIGLKLFYWHLESYFNLFRMLKIIIHNVWTKFGLSGHSGLEEPQLKLLRCCGLFVALPSFFEQPQAPPHSVLHRMPRFVGAAAAAPLELLKANGPIMWHICLNRSLFTWFQEHWNIQEWGEGGFIHSMFSQIPYTVFPHIISAETIHFWIWKSKGPRKWPLNLNQWISF